MNKIVTKAECFECHKEILIPPFFDKNGLDIKIRNNDIPLKDCCRKSFNKILIDVKKAWEEAMEKTIK